jgi:hypothetical protein
MSCPSSFLLLSKLSFASPAVETLDSLAADAAALVIRTPQFISPHKHCHLCDGISFVLECHCKRDGDNVMEKPRINLYHCSGLPKVR